MIKLRGTPQTGSAIDGNNVTLTFDVAPVEGDVVVVFGGHGYRADAPLGPSTLGYTPIATNEAAAPAFGAWYKRMGASPDSDVVCQGSGNAADGTAYACWVFSGVHEDVLDQTTVTAGPTTSADPDAPEITTQSRGAYVLAMVGSSNGDSDTLNPAGYGDIAKVYSSADTVDIGIAGGTKELIVAAAENPAPWTFWSSGAWFAITAALKPLVTGIFLRGAGVKGSAANGGDVTLTLATGADAPQPGDVVVVMGGTARTSDAIGPTGWTVLAKKTDASPSCGIWAKVMGATPDIEVVCKGDGNADNGIAFCCYVFGNVASAISDQTGASVGPTNSGNPDPPAIVTQTPRAWVLAYASSTALDGVHVPPVGYRYDQTGFANDNYDFYYHTGVKEIELAGAEDPASFTGWGVGIWIALTVALRPAGESPPVPPGGEGDSGLFFANG